MSILHLALGMMLRELLALSHSSQDKGVVRTLAERLQADGLCIWFDDWAIPAAVYVCAAHIESDFFSVDVVRRRDGVERIVEIGDGQVSDLVGWEAQRFAQLWQAVSKHLCQ